MTCNKIDYPTKEAAIKDRDEITKADRKRNKCKKLKPYQCFLCGQWHLTTLSTNITRQFNKPGDRNEQRKRDQ